MNKRLDFDEDDFLINDEKFVIPNYVELDDNNEFYHGKIKKQNDSIMTDQEFADLLKDLGIADNVEPDVKVEKEIKDIEKEKELVLAKINLEYQLLGLERAKFEKEKLEWEKYKQMSLESFQSEKEEFERYKRLEKEKIYLETKELVSSCKNLGDYLEGYKKIHDVSE